MIRVAMILTIILGFFMAAAPAPAWSKNDWYSVPVFYLSDRKREIHLPRSTDSSVQELLERVESDPGKAQPATYQHGMAGIINVPVRAELSESDFNFLQKWGGKKVTDAEAFKLKSSYPEQTSALTGVAAGFGSALPFTGMDSIFDEVCLGRFRNAISGAPNKKGILYIHGCCQTQGDSLTEAAKLSISTCKPVLMYDWATSRDPNPVSSYVYSLRALDISQILFGNAMKLISKSVNPKDTIVVAHSLGNWLLCDYLRNLSSDEKSNYCQIHFVKPDISYPSFLLMWQAICKHGECNYIYSSKNDDALWFSKLASNSIPRLGRANEFEHELLNKMNNQSGFPRFIDVSHINSKFNHEIPMRLLREVMDCNTADQCRYDLNKRANSECVFDAIPKSANN